MGFAYCGGQVVQSFKLTAIDVSEENSVHKVELIAVEKSRRAQGSDTCNRSEKSQFRLLVGAIPEHHLCFRDGVILASKTRTSSC